MSIASVSHGPDHPPPDATVRLAFVANVHRLLQLGYARLKAADYHSADEDRITQTFCQALEAATAAPEAPRWACRFTIHEKKKENQGGRMGKNRLELDIVLERTERGPHPRFKVEAKRMGHHHPASTYLGQDGLGAFLSGEYAPDDADAGMLGYVQSRTMEHWRDELAEHLTPSPGEYRIAGGGQWAEHHVTDGPRFAFCTRHQRAKPHGPITIYHTLLDFRAATR